MSCVRWACVYVDYLHLLSGALLFIVCVGTRRNNIIGSILRAASQIVPWYLYYNLYALVSYLIEIRILILRDLCQWTLPKFSLTRFLKDCEIIDWNRYILWVICALVRFRFVLIKQKNYTYLHLAGEVIKFRVTSKFSCTF